MKNLVGGCIALLLALGLVPTAASAAIVTTTYTGVITAGEDASGLLGTVGADLSDLSYQAIITLDTSVNRETPGLDGESDAVYGPGIAGNSNNPFVSVAFSVNGSPLLSMPLFDLNYGYVSVGTTIGHTSGITAPNFWDFFAEAPGIPGSLDTPFSLSPSANSYADLALSDGSGGYSLWLRGNVSSVTSVTAGVPEPSTWALMILGFGSAGALLRRRRLHYA